MKWIPKFTDYKHISFDLWLTIIKSNPEFKDKRNILFREFFNIDKPIEEVASVIRKYDILTNTINEKVGKNFDTYEIYLLILGDLTNGKIDGYNEGQLFEFYKLTEDLLLQYKPLLLNSEIPLVLNSLKKEGISMNILSNTAFIKGSSLRKILEYYELDQYFSFQIYSDEIGFSKPGTAIYQHAYNAIKQISNIAKHEVIHVGDNKISDYEGALKFGFNAHLLINTHLNEPNLQPV
jgi:putative hydrolase of the HAD superfamily